MLARKVIQQKVESMSEQRFVGQVAVITGGGKGIGRAIVRRLAAEGATVAFCGREAAAIDALVAKQRAFGHAVSGVALDVADTAALQAWVEQVATAHGRLDILVNNAGITGMSGIGFEPVTTMAFAEWQRVIDVNLSAAFAASQIAARHMKDAGRGSIVNISSVHAHVPNALTPHYDAAKAGLEALTRSVALYLGRFGVRCNAVAPGPVAVWEEAAGGDSYSPEERVEQAKSTALRRFGKPAEVAGVVAFLCSDDAANMTGSTVVVDGGTLIRQPGMNDGSDVG
jgi:NAD(P)-dependent dehydrogenase (short-subunit alcohol dehydrogenase family)